MSLETNLKIKRRSSGLELSDAEDVFLRRDYTLTQQYPALTLSAGIKTELKTALTDINYLYIRRSGSAATIQIFKNLSPESYTFADCYLIVGLSDVTSIYLKASVDTTVYIFIAGS